ncbi:MAG: DUF58 domain-containing protein [Bacteroidetes bacterium]|nr:DUF58 domain-containing protein [Bacteroidota bacterium]
MDTKQILKNVRQIEIRTRGLVNQLFSGEYHSVFKGRGMEFSEVREYQFGDDVRTIDWNVSARFNRPFVKVFEEERELTVMLLVDMSGSQDYGTSIKFKRDTAAELCAVLAFSAIKNNDKVGMIIFTDHIEKFIPPKKGRSHILRIIRDIIAFEPEGSGTDIRAALEYFNHVTKKRSIAFLVSDFMDEGYDRPLKIVARKHDLIAVELSDPREKNLPDIGLVKLRDAESGAEKWVDTSRSAVREAYRRKWEERGADRRRQFLLSNVDSISIDVQQGYIQPLVEFFRMREKRY